MHITVPTMNEWWMINVFRQKYVHALQSFKVQSQARRHFETNEIKAEINIFAIVYFDK